MSYRNNEKCSNRVIMEAYSFSTRFYSNSVAEFPETDEQVVNLSSGLGCKSKVEDDHLYSRSEASRVKFLMRTSADRKGACQGKGCSLSSAFARPFRKRASGELTGASLNRGPKPRLITSFSPRSPIPNYLWLPHFPMTSYTFCVKSLRSRSSLIRCSTARVPAGRLPCLR